MHIGGVDREVKERLHIVTIFWEFLMFFNPLSLQEMVENQKPVFHFLSQPLQRGFACEILVFVCVCSMYFFHITYINIPRHLALESEEEVAVLRMD